MKTSQGIFYSISFSFLYKHNHTVNKRMMDTSKILLTTHSTPTLPSQREGREFYSRSNQQSRNFCRETKKFPLLPSGKEGLGENGEGIGNLKTWHPSSLARNSCALMRYKNFGFDRSLKYFVLDHLKTGGDEND